MAQPTQLIRNNWTDRLLSFYVNLRQDNRVFHGDAFHYIGKHFVLGRETFYKIVTPLVNEIRDQND